jgi:membrane protein required for colicin V production
MIWVDYAILTIIVISALISIWRGFVKEVLSLIGWILAFWVAFSFVHTGAQWLKGYISVPSVRLAVAFTVLFVVTLLVAGVVNFLLGKLVSATGLSGTDRMLGVFFGIGRGAAIVAVLVLLAGTTPLPRDPWWKQSLLIGHFQQMALWARGFLPADLAQHIRYH